MAPIRTVCALLLAAIALSTAVAASAEAAVGIGPAIALGGGKSSPTTTAGAPRSASGTKEASVALVASTIAPREGQTVSGKIAWEVGVGGGTPSKVEFLVDGKAVESRSAAPFRLGGAAGLLDTTKLADGSHVLSAVAYGPKGSAAKTKVTVTVANQPAPTPPPTLPGPQPASGPVYWGATIGSQLTGNQAPWDMSAVSKFEELTQKKLSLVQFFQPFANCGGGGCSFYAFPTTPLENIRQHGAIPVLSWSSQSIPSSVNEPDFQLSDVISGRYDSYIREFATKAKAWGHPFFLRFNWEMNGTWFPWSEGVNGNQPGEFVTAWRHVHDIFAAVGATNVSWVWCPNVEPTGSLSRLASLYPGDAYVDWTGMDGYNWGTNPVKPGGWKSFDQIFSATYRYIQGSVAPSKPVMVGEVASTESGGSKAAWIQEMLSDVPAEFPGIRALLWFDKYDDGMDWPLETSPTATSAFAHSIQSTSFVGNLFSSLAPLAIAPFS